MLRALAGTAPMILFGGYLVSGAIYCYRKGEAGFRSPRTVKREEEPLSFFFVVALIAGTGIFFLAWAVYALVHWPFARFEHGI
jgi:hypothetical protein